MFRQQIIVIMGHLTCTQEELDPRLNLIDDTLIKE